MKNGNWLLPVFLCVNYFANYNLYYKITLEESEREREREQKIKIFLLNHHCSLHGKQSKSHLKLWIPFQRSNLNPSIDIFAFCSYTKSNIYDEAKISSQQKVACHISKLLVMCIVTHKLFYQILTLSNFIKFYGSNNLCSLFIKYIIFMTQNIISIIMSIMIPLRYAIFHDPQDMHCQDDCLA